MSANEPSGKIHFVVRSVLGVDVRVTEEYWQFIITVKHPPMRGREQDVQDALQHADEVRASKVDNAVHLYNKRGARRYTCVVVRNLNGEAFIISAYPTDAIKEGEVRWKK